MFFIGQNIIQEKVLALNNNWYRAKKYNISNKNTTKTDNNCTLPLFQPGVAFHIITSHLIYNLNQMTGFCKSATELKWVKLNYENQKHVNICKHMPMPQVQCKV